MPSTPIAAILEALNSYTGGETGNNIWQDVVLGLDAYDGAVNDALAGHIADSDFVVSWEDDLEAGPQIWHALIQYNEADRTWFQGRASRDEIAVEVGKHSSEAACRDAVMSALDALQGLSAADLDDSVVNVDAAVEAVLEGAVTPFWEFGAAGLQAVALGVVMNDGPWWSDASPQAVAQRIREVLQDLHPIVPPTEQATWDQLIEDAAYATTAERRYTLDDVDDAVGAAAQGVLDAWRAVIVGPVVSDSGEQLFVRRDGRVVDEEGT